MAIDTIRHAIDRMLGQTNDQLLKKYEKELRAVNALSDEVAAFSDDALRAKATDFRQQLENGTPKSSLMISTLFARSFQRSRSLLS